MIHFKFKNSFWHLTAAALITFMVSPFLILVLFCFKQGSVISFPIESFSLIWFERLFEKRVFWEAFKNSLIVTGAVGSVSTVIGTMAALGLSGMRPRNSGLNMGLLTVPVMLPPLVLGVALLTYFSRIGVPLGLQTVIAAHLVFTQPFVILIVYARFSKFDLAVLNSARDLGAGHFRIFREIVLPIVRSTIIGATLVAMALSLDDFVITFFTIGGGNTLPTFLWGMMRKGVDPSINIVGTILMAMSIGASIIFLRITSYRG